MFTGREPDQFRWNFDDAKFDSGSGRLTFNPLPNWSVQASCGYLHGPEQLVPSRDEHRITSSATYNKPFGDNNWATASESPEIRSTASFWNPR